MSSIWRQATFNTIAYPSLETFGWKQPDQQTLTIDWDSESNITHIRERVAFIRKGCSCKTGCSSRRCKCKKSGYQCGPGCKCIGCTNLPVEAADPLIEDDAESMDSSTGFESDRESILEDQVHKLMVEV